MKTTFKAVTDFWHNRVLVPAGSLVELTKAETKYLKHALAPVEAEVAKVVEAVKPAAKEDVKTDAKA